MRRLEGGRLLVNIEFVPTVPHCSLASIIGELEIINKFCHNNLLIPRLITAGQPPPLISLLFFYFLEVCDNWIIGDCKSYVSSLTYNLLGLKGLSLNEDNTHVSLQINSF